MATLKKVRVSQDVQAMVFTFNFDDVMTSKAGVTTADFGLLTTSATIFEIFTLPKGARVVGGTFERLVAFDTASYTVTLGDSSDVDRYLASADLKAAGTTALLLPWGSGTQGVTVEFSVTNADVCTTGQGRITMLFVIDGRAGDVTGHP